MAVSRRAFLVGAGALGTLSLAACTSSGGGAAGDGDPNATPSTAGGPMGSFAKEHLVVSRWSGDPWTSAQRSAAARWSAMTGATIEFRTAPLDDLYRQQAAMLRGADGPDIVYVHPSWFGQFAKAGYLAPVDDLLADSRRNPAGFSAASYVPRVYGQGAYQGQHYALPDFVSTIVLAYRTDVFLALGIDAPATTADIVDAAHRVNGTNGAAGIVLPSQPSGVITDVVGTLLTAQGNWWFDADHRPALDTGAATTAVQFCVDAARSGPGKSVGDAAAYAAQGLATMVIGTTPSLQALQDPTASTTAGKWTYVPLAVTAGKPGGELLYWLWCISAKSARRNAAYSFLQWYTDTHQQAALSLSTGTVGATKDFYTEAGEAAKLPFVPALVKALATSNPQPSLPSWLTTQNAIEQAVRDAIAGRSTVGATVDRTHRALGD